MLRIYCEAVVRYEEAQRLDASSSPLLRDRGHLAENPLHEVLRENADQVRLFARELGLSPACASSSVLRQRRTSTLDTGPLPRLRVVAGR